MADTPSTAGVLAYPEPRKHSGQCSQSTYGHTARNPPRSTAHCGQCRTRRYRVRRVNRGLIRSAMVGVGMRLEGARHVPCNITNCDRCIAL